MDSVNKILGGKTEKTATKQKPEPERYQSKRGFETAKVLRGWCEIENVYGFLKQRVPNGWCMCGGYIRYMCSPCATPAPASDLDIYCESKEIFDEVKKRLDTIMTHKHENNISLTYNRSKDLFFRASPIIQLIKPVNEGHIVAKGNLQTILENFDFTVVRAGLLQKNTALVDVDFQHDEEHKTLRIKNIHCPISSTFRFIKYCKKGYHAPLVQIVRLFIDWDGRGADYREKILDYMKKLDGEGITQLEIEEMEALMRID